jgi:hypothetical protein
MGLSRRRHQRRGPPPPPALRERTHINHARQPAGHRTFPRRQDRNPPRHQPRPPRRQHEASTPTRCPPRREATRARQRHVPHANTQVSMTTPASAHDNGQPAHRDRPPHRLRLSELRQLPAPTTAVLRTKMAYSRTSPGPQESAAANHALVVEPTIPTRRRDFGHFTAPTSAEESDSPQPKRPAT